MAGGQLHVIDVEVVGRAGGHQQRREGGAAAVVLITHHKLAVGGGDVVEGVNRNKGGSVVGVAHDARHHEGGAAGRLADPQLHLQRGHGLGHRGQHRILGADVVEIEGAAARVGVALHHIGEVGAADSMPAVGHGAARADGCILKAVAVGHHGGGALGAERQAARHQAGVVPAHRPHLGSIFGVGHQSREGIGGAVGIVGLAAHRHHPAAFASAGGPREGGAAAADASHRQIDGQHTAVLSELEVVKGGRGLVAVAVVVVPVGHDAVVARGGEVDDAVLHLPRTLSVEEATAV